LEQYERKTIETHLKTRRELDSKMQGGSRGVKKVTHKVIEQSYRQTSNYPYL